MNRYYFHICQDGVVTLDDEGMDLPDLEAARTEAASSAIDLLHGGLLGAVIQIMDDSGNSLPLKPAFN